MPVSSSTEHWIKPDALTINLNHFGDSDYLQVSVLAGAVVMAFKQDVIGYNAAHNYRTWPLDAANTYLETTSAYNVYARLTRSEVNARALVVYDTVLRDIDGREISYAEDGSEVLGNADSDFFFVFLGQISASVNSNGESVQREWIADFRFGNLNTNQYQNEEAGGEWTKMFRLNKVTDFIEVLKTISSAVINKLTVAKELVLFGKVVTGLKRSDDNDDDVPVSDASIPTTKLLVESTEKKFLRKDVDDRSKGKIATDKAIEVGDFVSGASGAMIYKDETTGQTVGELDKLYVRMKAYFETLEIINVNSIGGKQIISPAGSVKCVGVEETDTYYRCYFLAEQDGEKVQNRWKVGDQAYSQMFNEKEGVSNKVSNKYYWRLVVGVSDESVAYNNLQCHYVDLSVTDCDNESDVPSVGDVINQRGSRTDLDRMNFIEMSSVDSFSPNITLFHGVNSYSLDGKAYVSYGVDKSTNKAFMNVYGDMYVGDRQESSFMRYTQEGGLEIKGQLSVGTTLGGKDLQELINSATPEGYEDFVNKVTQDIEGLQGQIDGAIDSYFYQYEPSLTNYPAMEWDTEDEKKAHLNDTFTNLVDGRSWRWTVDNGVYGWTEITDTATTQALALAGQAQDTADGKRRVFVDTPKPPYDLGDLWSRGSDYPLMICVTPKDASGVYAESDFDYADNNTKLKEELQTLVSTTRDDLNNAIGQAKDEAVNNANAYTDEGKKALQDSIDELEKSKANIDNVYTIAQADNKISEAETSAINAAKKQADAAIALSETTIKAYADGVVDDEEQARIKQAQENLAEAKKYAEEQAQAVKDNIENSYLFQALTESPSTDISNGLVLTSLIQLRDTESNIMSGINGLINANKGDKSIATWWGGGMYDLEDYYTWNGEEWVVNSGTTVPSNIPSGLIRMDGTGYFAKGNFWWDANGKIYADPTALFLMFDVDNEAKSLSSTILALRDKQTEFESMWSVKTDSNGVKYLYSTFPLATQGGITMYTGTEGLDMPSIYNGLPIDGTTIYWENGVLKSLSGGGTADAVAWGNITDKPSWIGSTKPSYNMGELSNVGTWANSVADVDRIMYQAAGSSMWVAKSLSSIGGGSGVSGDYLPLSGGKLSGAVTFANNVWNPVGDDIAIGDFNYAGMLGLKSLNAERAGIWFYGSSGEDHGSLYASGTILYWRDYPILHSGNYSSYALPLSGGTLTLASYENLVITRNADDAFSGLTFSNRNEGVLGYIGIGGQNSSYSHQPCFLDTSKTVHKIWHSGNDGSGSGLDADLLDGKQPSELSVASATKLQTARTIWGQSFDGTRNITGPFTYSNIVIEHNNEINSYSDYASGAGTDLHLQYRTTGNTILCVGGGKVGIGTTSPSEKLHVEGTGRIDKINFRSTYINLNRNSSNSAIYDSTKTALELEAMVDLSVIRTYNVDAQAVISLHKNGCVGIGTTSPSAKLHVNGNLMLTGTESDNMSTVYNASGSITTNSPYTFSAITHALQFKWYDTYWQIGNIRDNSVNSAGFGVTYGNNNLRFRVTTNEVICYNNLLATGGITMYSDQRKKTILNNVELSLSQIANAPLVEHFYNSDDKRTTHVGSIAQYWANINDWFCKLDNEGYYTMEIQNCALASAISIARELSRYESKTDKTIKQLKKRICQLEEELERLKLS